MPQRTRTRAHRYTRTEWLAKALDLLARKRGAKPHIETLCRELKVTRGSFYWHFRSRAEFVRALVDYWDWAFTQSVVEQHRGVQGSPEDRLFSLMNLLREGRLGRYDAAIRSWATQERGLAERIASVDESRLAYLRSIFKEMGFRGGELEMRTRLFVVFHSMEPALQSRLTEAEEKRNLRLLHSLLTRR